MTSHHLSSATVATRCCVSQRISCGRLWWSLRECMHVYCTLLDSVAFSFFLLGPGVMHILQISVIKIPKMKSHFSHWYWKGKTFEWVCTPPYQNQRLLLRNFFKFKAPLEIHAVRDNTTPQRDALVLVLSHPDCFPSVIELSIGALYLLVFP